MLKEKMSERRNYEIVPMVDLKRQYQGIKKEIFQVITEIFSNGQYILGPRVSEFEKKIADYYGVSEAVGVASGTDAIHLSINALGIGEGDEVITTPFTFFATVEAILYTGARPVFVDVEQDTFNMDAGQIEAKITDKTRAILPVHIFGQMADMEEISKIAKRHGLKVIEDCAQSFGANLNGKKAGSFGNTGCFSFYPSKNLGGYGDGGIIILNDTKIADKVRKLRNHGSKSSYIHENVGFNSRLDEIQAGILLVKLKYIDEYNIARRQKAALYTELLSDKVKCPVEKKGAYHVFHQYTIRSNKRQEIQKKLRDKRVSSVVYYPVPLHLQEALRFLGYREGDFPVTEKSAKEVLSLPIYPELEESVIEKIAEIIKAVI
ncbi:MAG TPA: DegT/DnrJ/EryC1/StrS family aminotransferase [Thermodesulfovibrionales bacterium]|nr:DegT/DnrJ/EryC1/StrS family aminotransferase [Thermodesulfovibrionales bacterium]